MGHNAIGTRFSLGNKTTSARVYEKTRLCIMAFRTRVDQYVLSPYSLFRLCQEWDVQRQLCNRYAYYIHSSIYVHWCSKMKSIGKLWAFHNSVQLCLQTTMDFFQSILKWLAKSLNNSELTILESISWINHSNHTIGKKFSIIFQDCIS